MGDLPHSQRCFGCPCSCGSRTMPSETTFSRAIRIHQATLDHLEDLVPLFDGYRQFYKQNADVSGAKTFLAQRLAHHDSVIFMAYLDNASSSSEGDASTSGGTVTPVGFAQLYPSFSSVSMQRLWILNDLFVLPTARNQGVAHALLNQAEQFATATGAKCLTLETAHDNLTAQSLYERRNWQRDTEFYTYIFPCSQQNEATF
jgi:ribosomal protein S18 acetylase RimI-like enzyme